MRSSHFFLDFLEIGSAISSVARGRVHPQAELGSFDKLREIGLLLLWLFSTLRVVWWLFALREMFGGI